MKQSSSELTRQKLIDAATDIFVQEGYKAATVRDIVRQAGANQASINYHFDSKAELYSAVMQQVFSNTVSFKNEDKRLPALTPDQQVTQLMGSLLATGANKEDSYSQFKKLLAWEMIEPSGVLGHFEKEGPVKHHAMVMDIVRKFLPNDAREYQIAWAAFWLIGQCLMMRQAQNIIRQMPPELAKAMEENRGQLPDFLSGLALKGLKNIS